MLPRDFFSGTEISSDDVFPINRTNQKLTLLLFVLLILFYLLTFYTIQYGPAPDPVGYLRSNEQRARERMVAIQTVKLLRKRVIECYRKEGVNHYENCRDVAQDYLDVIKKKDIGQLQPEWKKPEMKDGWW